MEHKSKKYGIVVFAIILLLGLSFIAYYHLSQANVESQKALDNSDSDTSTETLASVSTSTVILIACVILACLLGAPRKKVK